jgi:hypothetical protein
MPNRIGGEGKFSEEETANMSKIVNCDVCGKMYNQSHLGSHKRLAHGQNGKTASSNTEEVKALESILSAYEKLPDSAQKEVRHRLANACKEK